MQLDQINANIRLRHPWEAVDLGFVMVIRWWKPLFMAWLPFALTISALAFILFWYLPEEFYGFATLLLWWLKPLYDRFLLNILSQRLFKNSLGTSEALRQTPALIKNTGLLSALTFRRFSLSRGYNLPIWQLEQLRGKERSKRQSLLHKLTHSYAIGLTIALFFVELILYFSLYILVSLIMPELDTNTFLDYLFDPDDDYSAYGIWATLLDHAFYTIALIIVEPFYVAASFTLYLNRRTRLEAWDLELAFRKLGDRLQKAARKTSPLLLAIVVFLTTIQVTPPAQASELEYLQQPPLPAEQAGTVIDELMQDDELRPWEERKTWKKKKSEKKKKREKSTFWDTLEDLLEPVTRFMSILFESALWILLGIGLLVLFLTRHRWLHLLRPKQTQLDDYQSPDILFGMDVREDSLPDKLAEEARKLWDQGEHRNALSLLYRGVLSKLLNHYALKISDSHTEGDILRLAKSHIPAPQFEYLDRLTNCWRTVAYAHQIPAADHTRPLFDHWNEHFEDNAS